MIGFAAEPGRPALDGATGENSPYASALLRHLGAMDGIEFGQVMRMVTEEVYLDTKTKQRPGSTRACAGCSISACRSRRRPAMTG